MASPWLNPEATTYEQWVEFVANHPSENTVLEYKHVRVFGTPSGRQKLVQDISAMANTYGGLMLLGVTGEDGSYAVEGFSRTDHAADSLRDRVVNLCVDMTWPPLFVEPLEAESADSERVVVVIRLWPRLETPTFFHSEGEHGCFECYVRAHGRKYAPKRSDDGVQWFTNIDLASDLPELQGRSEKTLAVRDHMLRMSRDRVSIWLQQMALEAGTKGHSEHNHLDVAICPLFPREPIAARADAYSSVKRWQAGFRDTHPLWFDEGETLTRFEAMATGARLTSVERTTKAGPCHWLYMETTDLGMVYFSAGLPGYYWPSRERVPDHQSMSAEGLCMLTGKALNLAAAVYEGSSYLGPLAIEWSMGPDIKWMVIGDLSSKLSTHATWHHHREVDHASGGAFWDGTSRAVGEALEDMAWTFRSPDSVVQQIRKWVAQYVGPE